MLFIQFSAIGAVFLKQKKKSVENNLKSVAIPSAPAVVSYIVSSDQFQCK